MKKPTPVALFLLCFALLSRADVLIYKMSINQTLTGNGQTTHTTFTGRLVVEATSNNVWTGVALIDVDTKHGQWNVEYPALWTKYDVSYASNKNEAAFAAATQGEGAFVASGNESPVDVGDIANPIWQLPLTMKITGAASLTNAPNFFASSTGALAFDKTNTQAANATPTNFTETISTFTNNLALKGYVLNTNIGQYLQQPVGPIGVPGP
jgi:hypothetical protein